MGEMREGKKMTECALKREGQENNNSTRMGQENCFLVVGKGQKTVAMVRGSSWPNW